MRHRFLIGFLTVSLTACTQLQMQPASPTSNTGMTMQEPTKTEPAIPETISGSVVTGSNDARVTMVLFTNPDCAYCKAFNNDLMAKLHAEFIDVGMLKVETISVPLKKYPNSERNAEILICASMSGSGANIQDQLFNGRSAFPSLRTCLEDANGAVGKIYATQQASIRSLDVSLIPAYVLNGKKYTGLPDYADLRGQITEAANR